MQSNDSRIEELIEEAAQDLQDAGQEPASCLGCLIVLGIYLAYGVCVAFGAWSLFTASKTEILPRLIIYSILASIYLRTTGLKTPGPIRFGQYVAMGLTTSEKVWQQSPLGPGQSLVANRIAAVFSFISIVVTYIAAATLLAFIILVVPFLIVIFVL